MLYYACITVSFVAMTDWRANRRLQDLEFKMLISPCLRPLFLLQRSLLSPSRSRSTRAHACSVVDWTRTSKDGPAADAHHRTPFPRPHSPTRRWRTGRTRAGTRTIEGRGGEAGLVMSCGGECCTSVLCESRQTKVVYLQLISSTGGSL